MSDPTKYYEAQSSGAKYIIGNRGEERFDESIYNLPVIIEFPKEATAEDRFDWYKRYNFFSTQPWSRGDAHDAMQTAIDEEYGKSGKWVRRNVLGGFKWIANNDDFDNAINFAPIIKITDFQGNNENISISFEKIPANTTLGLKLSTAAFGTMGQENYLTSYEQADKTTVASNKLANYSSITEQAPTTEIISQPSTMAPTGTGAQTGALQPKFDLPSDTGDFDAKESLTKFASNKDRINFLGDFEGTYGLKNIPASQIETPKAKALLADQANAKAYQEQFKDKVLNFLTTPTAENGLGINKAAFYNASTNPEGTMDFKFTMDSNGVITSLDLFDIKEIKDDGEVVLNTNPTRRLVNNDAQSTNINTSFDKFVLNSLGKPVEPTTPTETPTGVSTYDAIRGGQGGIGSFPLGQSLMAPGVPMPGSLQQQALSRVPLSDYRKALPAAMPGGGIPLMRGLYKTPLQLAQEAYLLSSRMGTFQPQGTIPGGTGAFGFQQYLGGQPNYIADLQAGLGAIQQVKQKIISGISPAQLTPAEQQIYTNYIGGTESNPYQGSENELSLRQQLTQLLPAPLRTAAQSNLQNIYNQALATRPSTVAGMPQSLMYGGALGTGSPFQSMQPMSVNVPTGTSPVGTMGQANQAPTQTINVTGSTNMNNVMTNNNRAQTQTQTADGRSIIFNRNPDTGYMQATLDEGKTGATGVGAATAAEIDALGLGLPITPTGGAFGNIMVKRLNDKVIDAWSINPTGKKDIDGQDIMKRTPLMQNLTNSKEANDQIKAQQIKVTNAKAAEQAKKIMTGSSKTQLGMDAPPPVPGMNAPIQPYSSVRFPRDITDPNFNVNENIFNF